MSGKKKMEGNPDANLTSIGNYIFQKTLGEGNFAKVKLAKHKITGQEVAIKIIDKMQMDDKKLSKLYREVRIMKLLHHPNIVKLYEVIETKNTIFLVMEYVSGGELYDYLVVHGRMKEKEARAKFRQILSAVSYCHKKRVIHRDLKAENLLLDANLDIKIADFGFSNQFDPDGKLDTFCGSPPYAAPELFQGKRYTGPEVDVWSLGVILYVLCTGCLPFDGKNLQEMRESVCRGKYRIPFYLSEGCEKLLRKFLVRDPTKRPSLDILADDPWLNEGFSSSPIVQDVTEQLVVEDASVLAIMETKFGIDKNLILKGLKDNIYDENMAIYFLLFNEKQKNGDLSVAKIGEQMAIKTVFPERHSVPAAEKPTVAAIREEDNGESTTPAKEQPAPEPVPAVRTAPVRRPRRATVSGENERKAAEEEAAAEDPEALLKLKNMQITQQKTMPADAQPAVQPRIRALNGENRPRPVSFAVPEAANTEKAADKKKSENEAPAVLPSVQPRSETRKRTNTITGFLKIRKDATDAPASPEVENSKDSVDSTASQNESKPRSLRFTFNSNTTSTKDPDEIIKEILSACVKHNIKTKNISRYLIECTATPPNPLPGAEQVRVEVEVCKLPRLKNLHGLKFKRLSGASNDYKTICELILNGIQL